MTFIRLTVEVRQLVGIEDELKPGNPAITNVDVDDGNDTPVRIADGERGFRVHRHDVDTETGRREPYQPHQEARHTRRFGYVSANSAAASIPVSPPPTTTIRPDRAASSRARSASA